MPRCRHLTFSEEAYVSSEGGSWTKAPGPALCEWADNPPERLAGTPQWMIRNALAGRLIRYPEDCAKCPAFEADASERR